MGRIVILLFDKIAPKTCQNFMQLCCTGKSCGSILKRRCFMGNPIHQIIPGLYFELGDVTNRNGSGGLTAQGQDILVENFHCNHDQIGTLSMVVEPNGTVNSKFSVTFKPLNILDKNRVVFGRVVKGLDVLTAIETYGSYAGKPKKPIFVSSCGVFN